MGRRLRVAVVSVAVAVGFVVLAPAGLMLAFDRAPDAQPPLAAAAVPPVRSIDASQGNRQEGFELILGSLGVALLTTVYGRPSTGRR